MRFPICSALAVTAVLILGMASAQAAKTQPKDIVDTAVTAGDFNTLAAALKAAGLVPGEVESAQVTKMTSAKTIQGQSVTISATGAGVTIDNAKVVTADIRASNGIIHVIDSVILPQ